MVDCYSRLLTITAVTGSIKLANAGLFDRPIYTDTDGSLRHQSTPLITSEDVPLNLSDIEEPINTDNNDNNEPVIISSSPLIAIEEPKQRDEDTTNAAIIATPTICKSFSECQTAASSLNIPVKSSSSNIATSIMCDSPRVLI